MTGCFVVDEETKGGAVGLPVETGLKLVGVIMVAATITGITWTIVVLDKTMVIVEMEMVPEVVDEVLPQIGIQIEELTGTVPGPRVVTVVAAEIVSVELFKLNNPQRLRSRTHLTLRSLMRS